MSARHAASIAMPDIDPSQRRRTPRDTSGTWRRIKTAILVASLGSAFVLPWLRWERGEAQPHQALLIDFSSGRAFVFGWTFGPQDLVLLLALLLSSAFVLFLTNTLVGRVWCGFTCPHTIWTDLFVMVERRLAPLGAAHSPGRRTLKHVIWLLIALATGLTFVSFFSDAPRLWSTFFRGQAGATASLFVLLFAGLTYLLAGHARELVCLHMCPWPRFQSAMTDARTLLVSYDVARGEPRGPLKRSAEVQSAGDCVDCNLCVAVCPTGIDIRNGSQLGCIGCGLCVDACNGVMAKVGRGPDLIGFRAEQPTAKGVRWRPLGFGLLALLAVGFGAAHLATRSALDVSVTPDRQPPYIRLTDGSVRNAYILRLSDRRDDIGSLVLTVEGKPEARFALATGGRGETVGALEIPIDRRRPSISERLTITLSPSVAGKGRQAIRFLLTDQATGASLTAVETYFWAPDAASQP